jgi:glycosyltransferase involved in cell wall biosynthesis
MKVLHVLPSISPTLGGPTQVALNLVHALCKIGVDAEIVTTNHQLTVDYPVNQRISYPISTDGDQQATIPVWFLPYNPPELKEFIFSKALTEWLWQHLATYDIIDNHYLFSYAPTCAAAIARFRKVPYTVRTMGQLTPWALSQGRFKKQVYSFFVERRNLNGAAAIHCTATDEAKDIQHFGVKTPTVTLPLGVNLPVPISDAPQKLRQVYNIPAATPVLLFLSRLHYKKQPDLLIQVLANITQQQDCHLILAGSGEADYLSQLKQLTASLGLSDRITFTGFVAGYDKNLLLQGADLFVLPSHSENFGIAVAEALAAGLPVVITPGVQIASEILAAQAGVVLDADLESLTTTIVQLLQNVDQRCQLAENGRRFAQARYAWTPIAQELKTIYKTIIDGKPL